MILRLYAREAVSDKEKAADAAVSVTADFDVRPPLSPRRLN